MRSREPECKALLEQTQESLRAMKLHIVNYQLKMLLLSMGDPEGNSYSPHDNGKETTLRNIRAPKSHH
jgi:hypothetical protein